MKRTYPTPSSTIIVVNIESLLCTSLSQQKATTLDNLEYGGEYTGTVSADSRSGGCFDSDDDLW